MASKSRFTIAWLMILIVLRFPNDSTWSSPVIASYIAVAMLGTLAFVLALTALLGPGEGRSAGMKLVAFFAAITAFPFQFGLGFGLVLLVASLVSLKTRRLRVMIAGDVRRIVSVIPATMGLDHRRARLILRSCW